MNMDTNEHVAVRTTERIAADRLKSDLRMLAADAELLLHATANQTGRRIDEARARTRESLAGLKARMGDLTEGSLNSVRAAGRETDEYVHANPWRVVAIGAVAGLGLGLLLAGRGSSGS